EVGVAVDDAGHEGQAIDGDHLMGGRVQVAAERGDPVRGDGDIECRRFATGAVEDQGVAKEEVVHAASLPRCEGASPALGQSRGQGPGGYRPLNTGYPLAMKAAEPILKSSVSRHAKLS